MKHQAGKLPERLPLIVVHTLKNALRVVAMQQDDRLSGIHIDQSLSDARAINPDIEVVQHDLEADQTLLNKIANWSERYTPLVSISDRQSLFLDITGCSHLFGGEEKLLEDMQVRLRAQGFCVQISVADTPGSAWGLSHFSKQQIAKPHMQKETLAALPLAALRLSSEKVRELTRLGFRSVGCLYDIPRAPVAARFGQEVLRRLDQALGYEDEAISPIKPVAALVSEKRFSEPIVLEDDIKRTITLLAGNLAEGLQKRGLGMRSCELTLFRTDGDVVSLTVEASSPLREAVRIAALFEERLTVLHDEWEAGFGFDIIRLSILRSDVFNEKQQDLTGNISAEDSVQHLVDRLAARLGKDRVQCYQMADTHIPERQVQLSSALHTQARVITPPSSEIAIRPLFLFERPELAEVMAEIPEGPPLRFRWRRVPYQVSRSEGPERIACEWWKEGRAAHTRDYFRIETDEGYRLWLFRHGLYERETNTPRWYVHGMFA